jgi:hypothetical protein
MKLRSLVVLAVALGAALASSIGTAGAHGRHPTRITLDSSVAVGGGYFVDSGRVFTSDLCSDRAVVLIGVRPDGTKRGLDWTLTSVPGNAWATKSKRTGFAKVKAKMRRTKHCEGASVLVFSR